MLHAVLSLASFTAVLGVVYPQSRLFVKWLAGAGCPGGVLHLVSKRDYVYVHSLDLVAFGNFQ